MITTNGTKENNWSMQLVQNDLNMNVLFEWLYFFNKNHWKHVYSTWGIFYLLFYLPSYIGMIVYYIYTNNGINIPIWVIFVFLFSFIYSYFITTPLQTLLATQLYNSIKFEKSNMDFSHEPETLNNSVNPKGQQYDSFRPDSTRPEQPDFLAVRFILWLQNSFTFYVAQTEQKNSVSSQW